MKMYEKLFKRMHNCARVGNSMQKNKKQIQKFLTSSKMYLELWKHMHKL